MTIAAAFAELERDCIRECITRCAYTALPLIWKKAPPGWKDGGASVPAFV
jgi:hypothetical protein